MSNQSIRFILDENVDVEIAVQLQRRGIYAISVKELKKFGEDDPVLLDYAIANGLVVISHDADFLDLAKTNMPHAGIVFIPNRRRGIGVAVKALSALAQERNANDVNNLVLYL